MAKFKVINNQQTISPLLTENEFPNSNSLFQVGSFQIFTNPSIRETKDYSNVLSVFSQPVTLQTLLQNNSIDVLSNISSTISNNLSLNFDKSNLSNYAFYGPLTERIRSAIENIINTWVGSLFIFNQTSDGNYYDTVLNYTYDSLKDEANFNVPTFLISNKFNLIYTNNSSDVFNLQDPKNINYSYNNYVLYDINTKNEFNIVNFIGSYDNNNGYINLTVKGNPYSASSESVMFHVKPNDTQYTLFYNNLGKLERYLLNQDTTPNYTIEVKIPTVNDDDQSYFINKKFTWTTSDG
jgi:hypothetical protein